jgi:ribosomal protein S18 acetylase RimI-like enzyme
MIFYSQTIINQIIDKEPIDNILFKIDEFKMQIAKIMKRYSSYIICRQYVDNLMTDENNRIAFYCFDNMFDIENCPTLLIYQTRIFHSTCEIRYYILLLGTYKKFRGQGYASTLLDEWIIDIRAKHINDSYTVKIILSSIEDAVLFYEAYGFKWMRNEGIVDHPLLLSFEKYEKDKEYFILEFSV